MSRIELKNINKYYGTNHVLKDVDLTIEDGEFMTLLGPSGCGKTTMLRVVSGLENPQSGTMFMGEEEMVNTDELYFASPAKRNLNLVFQSYALWPHMTVFNNVAFGLSIQNMPSDEITEKVENALDRMQILELKGRYPSELSGGQQQRVAIARAIVSEPETLLLDEPLSNLDAKLRIDMRSEIKRLHQELGTTIIYVTHDQTEALTMSTQVAIFFEGVLEQVAPPLEVYQNPRTLRIADFIGNPSINLVDGTAIVKNGSMRVKSDLGEFEFFEEDFSAAEFPRNEQFDIKLGIRPEQITLTKDEENCTHKAKIYNNLPAGSETLVQIQLGDTRLLSKEIGIGNYEMDEDICFIIDPDRMNVFNSETGHLIKYAIDKENGG